MAPLGAVALVAVLGGGLLALMVLTGVGARRRGDGLAAAVVSGLFFPVAWVVWHVRDRPYQTSPSRQSQAIGSSRSTSWPPST